MMSVATIRDALNAQPFRPFTVHVADQRNFTIPDLEFASIGPQNRTLMIWKEDEGHCFLDMLMITGIDVPASE